MPPVNRANRRLLAVCARLQLTSLCQCRGVCMEGPFNNELQKLWCRCMRESKWYIVVFFIYKWVVFYYFIEEKHYLIWDNLVELCETAVWFCLTFIQTTYSEAVTWKIFRLCLLKESRRLLTCISVLWHSFLGQEGSASWSLMVWVEEGRSATENSLGCPNLPSQRTRKALSCVLSPVPFEAVTVTCTCSCKLLRN